MFWVHCGLFVLVIAVPGFISTTDSTSKRGKNYYYLLLSICISVFVCVHVHFNIIIFKKMI